MVNDCDASLMGHAINLARRAWGETHPNPHVGALIVENGEIVAEGWHSAAGQAHAEVEAIRALGRKPKRDASLYVTLEPCSTHGRTGACTSAIIGAGIGRVVVGTIDPNPAHAGNGLALLRQVGIEVISGVREEECKDLNLIFNHAIVQKSPLLAAKVAATLDGKIATRSGHSKWITGEKARDNAHHWRRYFPAIAVGAGTLLADNPALTCRLGEEPVCHWRFVFDRRGLTFKQPEQFQLYTDAFAHKTIVVGNTRTPASRCPVTFWQLPDASDAFWQAFRKRCIAEGITGILVDGGQSLLSAMLCAGQLDYLFYYIAPKLTADAQCLSPFSGFSIDSMDEATCLKTPKIEVFGEDLLYRGHF